MAEKSTLSGFLAFEPSRATLAICEMLSNTFREYWKKSFVSLLNRKFVEIFSPAIGVLKSGKESVFIAICFTFPSCAIRSSHSFSFHASCSLCIDVSSRRMVSLQYCAVDSVVTVLTTNCHASYMPLLYNSFSRVLSIRIKFTSI